jgi:hypothetical protein
MIELNVLKTRLEKFRKQRVVLNLFVIYFAGLFFLLVFFAITFAGNRTQIKRIRSDIKRIENSIAAEKEKVDYIKDREKESKKLIGGLELFSSESENRVVWSPILAFTGQNVPSGIWLERFSVKESSSREKDKKETKAIVINGYVFPEIVNEREAIDRFVRNLSRSVLFSGVYLKEVKKEVKDKMTVRAFSVECELK